MCPLLQFAGGSRISGKLFPKIGGEHERHVPIRQGAEEPRSIDAAHEDRGACSGKAGDENMPFFSNFFEIGLFRLLIQVEAHLGDWAYAQRSTMQDFV